MLMPGVMLQEIKMKADESVKTGWQYSWLICSLIWSMFYWFIIIGGQSGPRAHPQMIPTMLHLAIGFHALIIARIVVAAIRRERNRDWIFYFVLCILSPIAAPILNRLIVMAGL